MSEDSTTLPGGILDYLKIPREYVCHNASEFLMLVSKQWTRFILQQGSPKFSFSNITEFCIVQSF